MDQQATEPLTREPAVTGRGGAALALASMRQVAVFILTLGGAVFLAQCLLWAAPGDPVDLVPGGHEVREALEAEWGLDMPLPARYATFMARAVTGDLGTSFTYRPGAEVAGILWPAAARSAYVLLPALALVMVWGLGLAWLTAGRPGLSRRSVQAVSVAPVFLLAFILVHVLNEGAFGLMEAGLIQRPGWFALPDQGSFLKQVLAVLVLAVGSGALADVHGAVEEELVQVRSAPFVDAAIARGAPTTPHVLLNLLPPLASVASSRAAFMVGGLVIVEKVLQLNGAGAVLWQACRLRDYSLAMGITFVAALVVCTARLLGDMLRLAVDPRIRGQGS